MTVLQTAVQEGEGRGPLLKRAGNFGLGLAVIFVALLASGLFLYGTVWLSEKALPWLMFAGQIAFAICGFVFLPLCIFRKSRPWAGLGFFTASYIFGVGLLAYSCVVAFQISGFGGLIVGLLLAGIGVVAIALLDALYAAARHRTQWGLSWDILMMLTITFGTRFLGSHLMTRDAADLESEGTSPTPSDNLSLSPPATPTTQERVRVLVVSTEEAANAVYSDWLCFGGYDAVGCDAFRRGEWAVRDVIQEARNFQPDLTFLFHLQSRTGSELALSLFECLPKTRFIIGRIGENYCVANETLSIMRSRGCEFDIISVPCEGEDLIKAVERQENGAGIVANEGGE